MQYVPDRWPPAAIVTTATQDTPFHSVIDFTFSSVDTDSKLKVICNGTCFLIYLFADNFSESPALKERYHFFLQVAEEFELDGYTIDDFYEWILEPFLPLLRGITPPQEDVKSTLHNYFYPEMLCYTLHAVAGALSPVMYHAEESGEEGNSSGVLIPDELASPWRSFHPSEILICADSPEQALSDVPRKVQPMESTSPCFLKLTPFPTQNSTRRKLTAYGRIHDAGLDRELLIPRLNGVVRDENGELLGLLLSYIDCKARTLACAVRNSNVSTDLRRKWKDQVSLTVHKLHEAGVVWGDVNADNVLIDNHDNAWVIDFGGGYTEGWMDKEAAGTIAGDLQGLEKICDMIEE